jgi:hypothetical protein
MTLKNKAEEKCIHISTLHSNILGKDIRITNCPGVYISNLIVKKTVTCEFGMTETTKEQK